MGKEADKSGLRFLSGDELEESEKEGHPVRVITKESLVKNKESGREAFEMIFFHMLTDDELFNTPNLFSEIQGRLSVNNESINKQIEHYRRFCERYELFSFNRRPHPSNLNFHYLATKEITSLLSQSVRDPILSVIPSTPDYHEVREFISNLPKHDNGKRRFPDNETCKYDLPKLFYFLQLNISDIKRIHVLVADNFTWHDGKEFTSRQSNDLFKKANKDPNSLNPKNRMDKLILSFISK